MLQAFEDAVLDQERSGQNIAVMSLQLGLPDPPLLHAWIACAGLPHAYRDPTVRSRFLVHYDEAVRGLAETLRADDFKSEEWMQATILSLHIFEASHASSNLHYSHTDQTRSINLPTTSSRPANLIFVAPTSYSTTVSPTKFPPPATKSFCWKPTSSAPPSTPSATPT